LYINDIITRYYKNNIQLVDLCEKYFGWDDFEITNKKWVGILHLTPTSPVKKENINTILNNENFKISLSQCTNLIFLSKYLKDYVYDNYELNIQNNILYHPISNTKLKFNIDKYLLNNNKYIIQIGQQLRILKTFITLKFTNYKKIWLTGDKDINESINKIKDEIDIDNINFNDIEIKYVNNNEFDELIINNIIFIHLYDASANNTVLEAIIYKTPIIINKHPAVVEYLGDNYPLYYNDMNEINDELLCDNNIILAHNYLEKIDESIFSYKMFSEKLIDIIDNYNLFFLKDTTKL